MSNFLVKDGDKAEWGVPEGYPYKEIGTILDDTFEFTKRDGVYTHQITDENFTYVDGNSYTVIWDGETYQCVATNYSGLPILGNLAITGAGTDTGEPFLFIIFSVDEKGVYANNTAATHTITVRGEIIHPMAPEFLHYATTTTTGTVKQAATVADVTAAPTAEEFNALLKSLRDAGILATE